MCFKLGHREHYFFLYLLTKVERTALLQMGKLKWKQMGNNLVLLIVIRGNGTIYIFETKGVNAQDEIYSTRIYFEMGMLKHTIM